MHAASTMFYGFPESVGIITTFIPDRKSFHSAGQIKTFRPRLCLNQQTIEPARRRSRFSRLQQAGSYTMALVIGSNTDCVQEHAL